MEDFSIESAIDRINDTRTKVYFREVFSSYTNGNYRSAVVMLWSVVVCDLIYKLQHLRDIDNDSTALDILTIIEGKQRQNPKSPDWEADLLKQVKERTHLLDQGEYDNLLYLQNTRHLSAHPILSAVDLLFSPNKDTCRALVRNALDGVLTKPPILTKQIIEEMVLDLAAKKDILIDDTSLKRYLEARYLRNLHVNTEFQLLRTLWKFVFSLINADADANRDINFRALKVIYARRTSEMRGYIQSHQSYFSNINAGLLNYLIEFLFENPTVYVLLTDATKVLIQRSVDGNLNLYTEAYFLTDSFKTHLEKIQNRLVEERVIYNHDHSLIRKKIFNNLYKLAVENDCKELVNQIAVTSYILCGNFDSADLAFQELLKPYLDGLSESQLTQLLQGMETNDQIWTRRRAPNDHKLLKERCDVVFGESYDYSPYKCFLRSIAD